MVHQLRDILSGIGGSEPSPAQASSGRNGDGEDWSSDDEGNDSLDQTPVPEFPQRAEEGLAIDGAENPLQLLARASYLKPSYEPRSRTSPQQVRNKRSSTGHGSDSSAFHNFFTPARVYLDIGDDVDPISLGLVSEEEAESLFAL